MAPGRILQIFLRVAIQDQIRIAQRVIVRLHFPIVAVLLPSAACNPSCAVLAGLSGHVAGAKPQEPPENKTPVATKITGKMILEVIRQMDAEERRELTRVLFA